MIAVAGLGIQIIDFGSDGQTVRLYRAVNDGSTCASRAFHCGTDRTHLYFVYETPIKRRHASRNSVCEYCDSSLSAERYFFDSRQICPMCRAIFVKVIEYLEEPNPFLSRMLTKLEYISSKYEQYKSFHTEIMDRLPGLYMLKTFAYRDIWHIICRLIIRLYFH